MRKILKGLYRKEEGQILVFTGLILAALMGFSAIAMDVGMIAIEKSKLQNVADAAALAGAQELPDTGKAKTAAVKYAKENGLVITTDDVITPVDGDNKKIKVVATRTVSHTMARLIDIDETDVSAAAVADKTQSLPSVFTDYAILSESKTDPLDLGKAGQSSCEGTIHTNNKLILGKHLTATRVEANSGITETGSNNIASRDSASANVIIPSDLKTELLSQVKSAKKYIGDKTFDGNGTELNESIYVEGNVTIVGNNVTANGFIYATGNITIDGNNPEIGSYSKPVFIYSEKDIFIPKCNNMIMYGIIFAPNGSAYLQKNNWELNGSIIANSFPEDCLKNNFKIKAGNGDFGNIPLGKVKVKLIG